MRTLTWGIYFTQRRVSANARSSIVNYRVEIEEAIKNDSMAFFGFVNLKKKRVGCTSVMHFKGRLAYDPDDICSLFADFIHMLMMSGCFLIPDQISCKTIQLLVFFSSLWMRYRVFCWSWMSLPLILKNCAFAFVRLFFLTDLYRHVFLSTGGNFST
jgi:hypothetical protein